MSLQIAWDLAQTLVCNLGMDLWTDDFKWFVWFLIRSAIYGYILYHAFCFLRRKVPGVLGYGPIRKDPNMRKLRRVELKDCIKGLLYLVGVVEHRIRVFRTDGYG
ncbi:hypothetical protein ERO13_D07G166300v2 [Gossypium hirsutum]|uniref:Uncharacterized protein n=1 Tax=Gossypium mustelinum TaxID=34275 RepID=A0A5D2U9R6_GOSMU|nr:hypothetical protein ERO13_D07G166300v2 [Gossypium hirsutum]TYI74249.1 hypothetical protein E1A91_D07G186500v1 [Gossypium mustelinum]TYI74250.1 hypothetical protein E1A91_D07G186500v1 [Gossypium mustelinum]